MFKRILLSGAALTVLTGVAIAQSAPPAATDNDVNNSPAATEMAAPPSSGAATGTPDSSATGGMAAAEIDNDDPNLFSNLEGSEVIGQNDENVGRVADVLIDSEGNIRQLVLGHGGVIGIGETLRVYDVASLPVVQDDKIRLDQLTTASLESLPEYEYPSDTETGRASTTGDSATVSGTPGGASSSMGSASGDAAGMNNSSSSSSMGGGTAAQGTAGAPASTDTPPATASAGDAPTGSSGAQNTDPASMPVPPASSEQTASSAPTESGMTAPAASGEMWPVSRLVGATVTNADESAEIEDLRFAGNKIDRVVIDKGGVLGLGEDEREIAFANLIIGGDPAEPTVTMNATAAGQVNTETPAAAPAGDAPESGGMAPAAPQPAQ